MKDEKDIVNQDKVNKIYDLIDKSDIKNFITDGEKYEQEVITGDDIPEVENIVFHGLISFRMDPMKMNLYMELKAPVNSENVISMKNVRDKTDSLGAFCVKRIDWSLVGDIYQRVIFDGEMVPETVVAKGQPAEFYIPEHIIIKEELYVDLKPERTMNDSVNYHHIKSFVQIKANEFIGDLIPATEKINGKNLAGVEIPAPTKIINNLTVGKNISVESGKLYSAIDGALKILDDQVIVDDLLVVVKDIDYSTGDINFSGDIDVGNSIREGFSVTTTRDISVKDTIEPTNIECGNNLVVGHGIIGSDKYKILCKGSVHSVHIEHATVKAAGSVIVNKSIISSKIYSLDCLNLGDKGKIVGGEYHILNNINTGELGNEFGVDTKIYLGVDYQVEEKLKLLQEIMGQVSEEM
ncbi:MAG: DUF342 domain-containing protein, partial [Spirochaetales bacterium]|nr:DUF342 domain-containing protein [Spirochaetales bacterium]